MESQEHTEGQPRTDEQLREGQEAARSAINRMVGYAKGHPLTSLGLIGAAVALGGAEWAAGALIGGAVAAFLTRDSGRELRHHLGERARSWLHRGDEHRPAQGQT